MIDDIVLPLILLGVFIWFYGFITGIYGFILSIRLMTYLKQHYPYDYELLYSFQIISSVNAFRIWDFLYSDRLDSDIQIRDLKNKIRENTKKFLYACLFFVLILVTSYLISLI